MKLIIDIDEKIYEGACKATISFDGAMPLYQAVREGTRLPDAIVLPDGIVYSPELYQGCIMCDACEHCADAFHSNAVNCNAYGKENENG